MPSYTAQVPSGRPSCLLENKNHPLQTGADTLTSCKSDEEEPDPPPDCRPHHGLVSLHQTASLLTAICQLHAPPHAPVVPASLLSDAPLTNPAAWHRRVPPAASRWKSGRSKEAFEEHGSRCCRRC